MQSFPLKSHLEGKIVYYNITLFLFISIVSDHRHRKMIEVILSYPILDFEEILYDEYYMR